VNKVTRLELISTIISAAVSSAVKEAFAALDREPNHRIIKKKPVQTSIKDVETDVCHRCNRTGHFAKTCYAKTHKDGHEI
jgi:hypothetical protein